MLKFETILLSSAELGKESNLPDIPTASVAPFFHCDETVDQKQAERIGSGMIHSILPYKIQNQYGRETSEKEYFAAILEDENLKAVFLPQLGGRLWSLYDKKMGRDLIYCNGAVKFGNLALCNAWFAGGVEWNLGIKGHTPLTCRPLFVRGMKGTKGHDILRMYEYEEKRGLVYCIEALLENGKLVVQVTIENPQDEPTWVYWWSNIATAQKKGTRIFVPADLSYITSYREGGYQISKESVPYRNGKDISDPYHPSGSIDYFFDIPQESKKWIACVDEDGTGLLHSSDDTLQGRKMFLWGTGRGGSHWNQWLTEGGDYLEIQAGVFKTQFEHGKMEPHSKITWVETYEAVSIGTSQGDYHELRDQINEKAENPSAKSALFANAECGELVLLGSARGYLAEQITGKKFSTLCEFPAESAGKAEEYYLALLNGTPVSANENTTLTSNAGWLPLIRAKKEKDAYDLYLMAMIEYANEHEPEAVALLEEAVTLEEQGIPMAALALLYRNREGRGEEAFAWAQKAVAQQPDSVTMAILFAEISIRTGHFEAFTDFFATACETVKVNGRVRMLAGQCLVELGRLEEAEEQINGELVVPDIREGEYSISNIWMTLYRKKLARDQNRPLEEVTNEEALEAYPLPYAIDFRMK